MQTIHSPAHDVIGRIAAFPMEKMMRRHVRDDGVTGAEAAEHERELRRYLSICALHPTERFPMFPKVDGLWHVFILYTGEYASFCRDAAGRFIHHAPNDDVEDGSAERVKDRGEIAESYRRFRHYYESYFHETPPDRFWPTSLDAMVACNGDGDGCTQDTCGDSCKDSGPTCR